MTVKIEQTKEQNDNETPTSSSITKKHAGITTDALVDLFEIFFSQSGKAINTDNAVAITIQAIENDNGSKQSEPNLKTPSIVQMGREWWANKRFAAEIYAEFKPLYENSTREYVHSVRELSRVVAEVYTNESQLDKKLAVDAIFAALRKNHLQEVATLTEAMKNIRLLRGEKLDTKEMVAICEVAKKSGSNSEYTLPALTEAMKLSTDKVTPELITELGSAVVGAAWGYGYDSKYTLLVLTEALRSSKDKVTPELITKLGDEVVGVAKKSGMAREYTLRALTEAMKLSTHKVTPELIQELGGALAEVAAKSLDYLADNYSCYSLPALTEAMKNLQALKGEKLDSKEMLSICEVAKKSGEYSKYTFAALTEAMKLSTDKFTPALIQELGGALAEVAAKYLYYPCDNYSESTLPALTEALKLSKDKVSPELIKELGSAIKRVAEKSGRESEHTLPAMTEAMKNIRLLKGEKLDTKEMLAICKVAAESRDRSIYTLPALTEAMKLSTDKVTPELITELGSAVVGVAWKYGYYSKYILPVLTEALRSSKDKVTPELITKLGDKVVGVAARVDHYGSNKSKYTLPVLTGSMKNIQSLKGENLGTKEISAICEMVLKSGDSIYHTLPALTKGLQLTKQPVTPRLIQGVGDLVVLISKSNKDQKTLLSETKKILSSYRGLIDEEALSLISEGAALITPNGLSNIMAIEARHGIPFESVSQLKELVSTIKECHNPTFLDEAHKQKLQSTLSKESIAVIEHQVTIKDLRRLVFSQYNSYGRNDFDQRIQNWGHKTLPPALKVTSDREFEIRAKAGTATLRVIPGKDLNQKLFEAVSDKVIADPKNIEDRLKSLYSLAGIPLPEKLPDVSTQGGKKEIFLLLKTMPQEKLRSGLNAIKPVLPVLCESKIRMAHFGEVSAPNIKEIYDFYGSVITAYEHIDDVLTREGIQLTKEVKQVVFDNFTKPIKEELDKFRFSGAKETRTVKLVGTKNIYDTFYDAIGESCLGNKDLERSDFQPIRLVDPDSGDHYGVVYAVKSEINGTPSLVLFGVEIRREYAYSITQSELMPKLIEQLGLVAKENGLREVWTTTDSTRLAQYDVTRNAVTALSKSNAEINAGIKFPSHYSPATRFAKLWG